VGLREFITLQKAIIIAFEFFDVIMAPKTHERVKVSCLFSTGKEQSLQDSTLLF